MESTIYFNYLQIVRSAVSFENRLSTIEVDDWGDFLSFCNRHGIVGIVFDILCRSDVRMDRGILYEWLSLSELIRQQNVITNERQQDVALFFSKNGFRSCLLKGQANGLMYPQPALRTPGDIDIWIDGSVTDIIKLVRKTVSESHFSYHHIDFPLYEDVMIEVHYTPIHLNNWVADKKLQKFFNKQKEKQFRNWQVTGSHVLCCPTREFNAIYLMLHMYGHFFTTRNNLKQLIDYYYLLKGGFEYNEKEFILNQLNEFGILKFSSGIMWIMQEVFGVNSDLLLTFPNAKLGMMMLEADLHYNESTSKSGIGMLKELITSNKKFLRDFPVQIMILPIYMLWHQWWKKIVTIKLCRNKY